MRNENQHSQKATQKAIQFLHLKNLGSFMSPEKAMKRKIIFEGGVLPDLYSNMADNKDLDKKKCHSDENITSDGASKVIAVELNKRLPKAKENEQDPIPSDGEDGYPELNLDPAVIEQRKKKRIEKNKKENSSTIEKKQETQ